jgi:hypothetical protein
LNVEAKTSADVTARTYGLIGTVQDFCKQHAAAGIVQDWGNMRG